MNRLPERVQRRHQVIGPPHAVANAIETAHRQHRLVQASPVRWVNRRQVAVDLVLLDPAPRPRRRWVLPTAVGTTVAAALGGAVYVVYTVGTWTAEHWQELLGAAALAALALWWLLGRVGACPGLHCPGCKCS